MANHQAAALPPATPPPYDPNLTELENFTARLTEEQREQFKKVIEEQVRHKTRARFLGFRTQGLGVFNGKQQDTAGSTFTALRECMVFPLFCWVSLLFCVIYLLCFFLFVLLACMAQYRRTEREDRALEKQRARFDINWGQVLMWGSLFVAWLYYK